MAISKKRISYIDGLRGFATILVVLGHVSNGYAMSFANEKAIWPCWNIYNVIYTFHMALFMLISGFVFARAYAPLSRTDVKSDKKTGKITGLFFDKYDIKMKKLLIHTANIIIIYLLFSMIFGYTKIYFDDIVTSRVTEDSMLIIWKNAIAPYWYLYILVPFNLVFALVRKLGLKSTIYTVIFLAVNILSVQFSSYGDFELYRMFYYAFFFSLGTLISDREFEEKKMFYFSKWACIPALIAGILLIYHFWNYSVFIFEIPYVNTIIALLILPSVYIFFKIIGFEYKYSLLRFIGKYSLEIYVMHIMFTAMMRYIFRMSGVMNVSVCIIFGTVVGIFFPVIIAKLLDVIYARGIVFKPFSMLQRQ